MELTAIAQDYTLLHIIARDCTPKHTKAHHCTRLHNIAQYCTRLHTIAHFWAFFAGFVRVLVWSCSVAGFKNGAFCEGGWEEG